MASVNKEPLTISETHPYRFVPSVRDGLVPTQRKILHTLLQQKSRKEVKVVQLAGNVSAFFTHAPD
jgi:DNA gyrase/topoisomerase IV subunit A